MTTAQNADVLAHFRRLVVKRGLTLGTLATADRAGFRVVLSAAACAFDVGRDYREPEVNSVLRDWLAAVGAMLDVDHVELRRWLVDCGLLARDGYGRRYVRAAPPPPFADAVAALESIDGAAVARAARDDDAARRAARKARWLGTAAPEATPE
jgi:hypothetical protein